MTSSRTLAAVVALAFCAGAFAQASPPAPEPPKPPEKSTAPAKPKKPAAPKKAPAKKAAPKKADAAKSEPKKAAVYTTGPGEVRDKDGKVIPTSPDAYNVDSAMPPKPRK
jgi:hypothetical protein